LRQLIVLVTNFTNKDAAARRFIPIRPMQFGDFRFRRFFQGFRKKTGRHGNKTPRASVLGYGGRLNSSRPGRAVDDALGGAPKFLA
jgi:hypothetical protein